MIPRVRGNSNVTAPTIYGARANQSDSICATMAQITLRLLQPIQTRSVAHLRNCIRGMRYSFFVIAETHACISHAPLAPSSVAHRQVALL